MIIHLLVERHLLFTRSEGRYAPLASGGGLWPPGTAGVAAANNGAVVTRVPVAAHEAVGRTDFCQKIFYGHPDGKLLFQVGLMTRDGSDPSLSD